MATWKNRIHPINNSSLFFLIIIMMSIIVRLVAIQSRPIWYDEAFSILFSEKGPSAIVYGTLATTGAGSAEEHPIMYYTLLWLWMSVFGKSIIAARLLSIIFSIGVVVLIYQLGKELFDKKTAQLGAILVALAPFQIHYAQEIRMYSLLEFFLAFSTYSLYKGLTSNKNFWWPMFSFGCALAQYSHNLAFFYLVPLSITPLFDLDFKKFRKVFLWGLVAVVLYLPWGQYLPAQFSKIQVAYWIERPDSSRIFTTMLSFVTNLPLTKAQLLPGLTITLLVIAIACWQSLKALRAKEGNWRRGIWLFYLSVAPPSLLFVFSQWRSVFIERALLASAAVFCLWLAWVLTQTKMPYFIRSLIMLLLMVAAAMGLYQHIKFNGFPYAPYEEISESLSSHLRTGDVIIHSNKLSLLPMLFHENKLPQVYIVDPPGSGSDTLAPATRSVLALSAAQDIESAAGKANRIWLIIFQKAIDEYTNSGKPSHPHLEWLFQHYRLIEMKRWGDLVVYQFGK